MPKRTTATIKPPPLPANGTHAWLPGFGRTILICEAGDAMDRFVLPLFGEVMLSPSGETPSPVASRAGRLSKSNNLVVRWVLKSKKTIPGLAAVSR